MLTGSLRIIITAIPVLIGSVAMLIIGIFSLSAGVLPKDLRFSLITMGLAIWGIATGIGMLRLQRWARLSILVFSVGIASWTLLAAPIIVFYPSLIPTDLPKEAIAVARSVLPILFALFLAFAFWCIYLLNTDTSKSLFGLPRTVRTMRPVSTSVIGGFLLVSAILGYETMVTHGPAMLFGSIFTGWKASTIWLLASTAELYLGIGLLMVNPRSRVLAVCFFLFQLLETVAFLVRPDRGLRVADYYHALDAYFQRRRGVHVSLNDVSTSVLFWSMEWSVLILFAIWYLVKCRKDFNSNRS